MNYGEKKKTQEKGKGLDSVGFGTTSKRRFLGQQIRKYVWIDVSLGAF